MDSKELLMPLAIGMGTYLLSNNVLFGVAAAVGDYYYMKCTKPKEMPILPRDKMNSEIRNFDLDATDTMPPSQFYAGLGFKEIARH